MSFQFHGRSAALSAAISAVLASPAWAAAPAAGPVQLEEIVVTAQRTETNLQQTPISVAAVSGEALAQQGASTLLDLTTFIPNLQVGSTTLQGGGNGRFAIRGIGQDAGTAAAVGLYIDEVFYPTGAGNLMGLFDVDRVEVLRGPQGTLFGRNTIGGAIQYVTVKPGDEFGGFLEATGGNFGRTDFNGALNVPMGDILAARVSFGYNNRDGFVRDLRNNVDRGDDKRTVGRLQLRATPTESLTIDIKGEVLRNENNGRASTIHGYPGAVFPTGLNDGAQFPTLARVSGPGFPASVPTTEHLCPSVIPNGPCINATSTGDYEMAGYNAPDYTKLDYTSGALVIGWDVNNAVTLKSITGYSVTKNDSASDTDSTPASFLLGGGGPPTETEALSQEVQVRLTLLDDRLRWTTGFFYYDENVNTPSGRSAFGLSPVSITDGSDNNLTSKAVFTQATFDFTERFSGTLGLRYSEEESDRVSLDSGPPFSATALPVFKGDFNDTSPQAGLQFQANPDLMVYVNAAKGFRAGGFGVNQGFSGGAKSFDPEEAWTYELGARMEFLDRRLRVNPTVFFTDWTGIQVNTLITIPEPGALCQPGPGCSGVGTVPQNIGDAEIKGLEFEALFQATDRLALQASFGYIDGKYTKVETLRGQVYPYGFFNPLGPVFVPNLCDGNNDPSLTSLNPVHPLAPPPAGPGGTGAYSAAQLAALEAQYGCNGASDMNRSPEFKFSVGARYAIPLSSGAQVVTSADYGWTDDQRSQVANLDAVPLPSYGVVNARVQYTAPDNRWSLAVFGTNLANEYYYLGGTDFAGGYTPGATVWDPARPREYGATVRFNF